MSKLIVAMGIFLGFIASLAVGRVVKDQVGMMRNYYGDKETILACGMLLLSILSVYVFSHVCRLIVNNLKEGPRRVCIVLRGVVTIIICLMLTVVLIREGRWGLFIYDGVVDIGLIRFVWLSVFLVSVSYYVVPQVIVLCVVKAARLVTWIKEGFVQD